MVTQLETHIPLSKAAKKYGISIEALTRLVRDGIIKPATTEEGDSVINVSTVAAAADVILGEIRPGQYEYLQGERIRLMEAARKYKVAEQNLLRWAERGYLQITDRGFQRLELDEADVKFAIDIYERACELTGSPIKAGWVLKRVLNAVQVPAAV
jgi:predicted site-specific integrase-resolvase